MYYFSVSFTLNYFNFAQNSFPVLFCCYGCRVLLTPIMDSEIDGCWIEHCETKGSIQVKVLLSRCVENRCFNLQRIAAPKILLSSGCLMAT